MICLICEIHKWSEEDDNDDDLYELFEEENELEYKREKKVFCDCEKIIINCIECGRIEETELLEGTENIDYQECVECYKGNMLKHVKELEREGVSVWEEIC